MPVLGPTTEEALRWVHASDDEIPGNWKALARLARRITGKVPSRVAARRSGISHDTVLRLWEGDRISVQKLVDFAQGYGVDAKPLLEAAGYPIFGERTEAPESPDDPLPLVREPAWDEDTLEVAHLYSGIPDPRMRARIKELMRTAIEIIDGEPDDAGPSRNGTD